MSLHSAEIEYCLMFSREWRSNYGLDHHFIFVETANFDCSEYCEAPPRSKNASSLILWNFFRFKQPQKSFPKKS